jgi:N-acetylmuramoyl-L-alanine amidase
MPILSPWWHFGNINNPKKLLSTAALFALLTFANVWCNKKWWSKDTPNAGKLSNLTSLNIQWTDSEEIASYKKLIFSFEEAQVQLNGIIKNHPSINKFIGEHTLTFDDLLPLLIKESRLHSDLVSRNGAIWYGQLQPGAIQDMSKAFKAVWETQTFNPESKPKDNLLYTIAYFTHLKLQVVTNIEKNDANVDEENAFLFTMCAYNTWFSKWASLYKAAGSPKTRDDFASRITKKLMKISTKPIEKTDPSYNVKWYTDRFGWKKFDWNKTVLYKDPTKDNILTSEKAYEAIRYVEIISAIKDHLEDIPELYTTIDYKDHNKTLYSAIKWEVDELVKQWQIKDWGGGKLIDAILLDNGISSRTSRDNIKSIWVTKNIISPFLVNKSFKEYSHDVKEYSKENKIYLRTIINTLLDDKEFILSLGVFNNDINENWLDESKSVIRQYLLESIVRFNQERRYNWSENTSANVWMPKLDYFKDYKDLKNISSDEVEEDLDETVTENITTWSNYTNESDDKLWNTIKEWPTSFNVIKAWNEHMRKEITKNGSRKPSMIVIHGTESADINEGSNDVLSKIHAHFYISRDGQIFQFIATEDNRFSSAITYPTEITAMNHAWVWLQNSYGAIRKWSTDETYSAVWIEVESSATSPCTPAQKSALAKLVAWLSTSYKIPQKNIVSHMQIAASKLYGRWRKMDLFNIDRAWLWLINNYNMLDHDVISGKTSPNMHGMIRELKERWCNKVTIKKILNGLNISIKKHREVVKMNSSTPTYNKQDINAWKTLEELEAKWFL